MAELEPFPVRMEHALEECSGILFVDWQLGNSCNYACSYCPTSVHDGSLPWLSFDIAVRAVAAITAHARDHRKQAHFQFTGGEPTLYPSFTELLAHISANGATASVLSNGTRPVSWWSNVIPSLLSVALSFHLERASVERFGQLARFLSERVRTHINVTMVHTRFEECLANAKKLRELSPNASIALKPLREGFGNILYPYDSHQLQILGAEDTILNPAREQLRSAREAMRMELSDGTSQVLEAGQIVALGLNRWRGWCCYAGVDLLMIDARGRIFRAQCRQGGPLGNIRDEIYHFPTHPIACTADACSCHSDIMNRRYRM